MAGRWAAGNAATTSLSVGGGVLEIVIFLKGQGSRIDAIAQAGGRRAILKHVALVGAAQRAFNLHPVHPAAVVWLAHDIFPGHRLEEAGPPGAGIEFGLRRKQRQSATNTTINTRLMLIIKSAAEGRLRALGAGDVILFGRQLFAPFLRRF